MTTILFGAFALSACVAFSTLSTYVLMWWEARQPNWLQPHGARRAQLWFLAIGSVSLLVLLSSLIIYRLR